MRRPLKGEPFHGCGVHNSPSLNKRVVQGMGRGCAISSDLQLRSAGVLSLDSPSSGGPGRGRRVEMASGVRPSLEDDHVEHHVDYLVVLRDAESRATRLDVVVPDLRLTGQGVVRA